VTARGLTTSPIFHGERAFQIDFDFLDHVLQIETSDGSRQQLKLRAQPVADFHAEVMAALADLSIEVEIKREAQRTSHEVSSAGFWPGGGAIDYPAFYSYT
jgi:uncharacterized protein DUF5996